MQKIDSHLRLLKNSDSQRNSNEIKINPLHALIAKKLYNEMSTSAHTNIIPGNNSSGTSTQGSSIKDFKSSSKKRKLQQECYYKTTINKNDAKSNIRDGQNKDNLYFRSGNLHQLESINPNIFIVEESKHGECDEKEIKRKVKKNQLNLHEYCLDNLNEACKHNSNLQFNEHYDNPHYTKALKTIESDDRNLYESNSKDILFVNGEISRIEPDFSNVYEEPQHETQKDLENLLQILSKSDN